MAGGFDPEKYRRRHLYGHEQKKGVDAPVEVVEEPKAPENSRRILHLILREKDKMCIA